MPNPIYRKDYQVSDYLIKTTELIFTLSEDKTIVQNTMVFYKNPLSKVKKPDLFLNGKNLELLTITKNNQPVIYNLSADGLAIKNPEKEFSLCITSQIYPHKNTSLNGLYKSSGNFCSQCEPHGFREITYYLDRPDVLSIFTTTIIADKTNYPFLLSNGNLIQQTHNTAVWYDPHPKPCYLFALVAGDFFVLEDKFISQENKTINLKIYVEKHNSHKVNFAMEALKKSFKWDEDRFNLSYDLDDYMIVAVDDFNMGAMENKGLNIFNSKYILATTKTATDKDFIDIEAVIGHEYFHNWTGNRITCQDWFQLSLKEGLTVFRDQEFTADCYDRGIKRIDDVSHLRTNQFSEDSGAMSHPVRPESYLEMNNFYTSTIYEKGAELVRMLHTMLGEAGFQAGMSLYIKRYDGQAVTIADFLAVMAEANQKDLAQFKYWYKTSGTPKVDITSNYNAQKQELNLSISQTSNSTSALLMPFSYALFEAGKKTHQGLIELSKTKQNITIKQVKTVPIVSYFRGFSSPIIMLNDNQLNDKIQLLKYEDDGFSAWDNAQDLWLHLLLEKPNKQTQDTIFSAFKYALENNSNQALLARLITLPNEQYLAQKVSVIDAQEIFAKHFNLATLFAKKNQTLLARIYQEIHQTSQQDFSKLAIAGRALKNVCLQYLTLTTQKKYQQLALNQFHTANNMTDKFSALSALVYQDNPYRKEVLSSFYQQYQEDILVIDKWFSIQASATDADITIIKKLMQHPYFSLQNPNRLRSLIGVWCHNHHFHHEQGYALLVDIISKLNQTNPQVGARLCGIFNHHKKYRQTQGDAQRAALDKILSLDNLSNDILEIAKIARNN